MITIGNGDQQEVASQTQTTQTEPQTQTEQVQQTVQTTQQKPLSVADFTAPAIEPVVQQRPAPQIPTNVATKDDIVALANVVTQVNQEFETQKFERAMDRFKQNNPDHAQYSGEILEILEDNPNLWQNGYDKALAFALSQAKVNALNSQQSILSQTTESVNAEIAQTKANIQGMQNVNTNPQANNQQQEESYGERLVRLARGNSLFG